MNDETKKLPDMGGEPLLSCHCIRKDSRNIRETIYQSAAAGAVAVAMGSNDNYCPMAIVQMLARGYATAVLMAHRAYNKSADLPRMEAEAIALVENAFQQLESEIAEMPNVNDTRSMIQSFALHPYKGGN